MRRLSLDALIRAKEADAELVAGAALDADAQVRRLAMRAGAGGQGPEYPFVAGLADPSAMVRIEALRTLAARKSDRLCTSSIAAASDRDVAVALVAFDQLAACGGSRGAIALLDRTMTEVYEAGAARGWHRAAHAIVALAGASPERATRDLPQLTGSVIWQLRMYAARAATILEQSTGARGACPRRRRQRQGGRDRGAGEDRRSRGRCGLHQPALEERLSGAARRGDRARRHGRPGRGRRAQDDARAAGGEGDDNSRDAREAIEKTLKGLGAAPPARRAKRDTFVSDLNAEELRRLAAPRARLTVRGVGTIEIALITAEAPATVLRFVRLAQSGYYNGLTFHRVEPNFVIQGGSPGANEYIGDASFMRDELGQWPHVRGAVGISTRGRDTGDAQLFIDLVDNPVLDHEFTVFGQVLNGLDRIDRILEGDVIEKVEITPAK